MTKERWDELKKLNKQNPAYGKHIRKGRPEMIWDSRSKGTYIRAKHGVIGTLRPS